jgi:imidazolonepropionase-like amidohydrolase
MTIMDLNFDLLLLLIILSVGCTDPISGPAERNNAVQIWEVNRDEIRMGEDILALTGGTVFTGKAGEIIENATIIVRANQIAEIGPADRISIPANATTIDLKGKYLLPGLMDAHFHEGPIENLLPTFLHHGVTSVRDPGAWIESYRSWRQLGAPIPRLFLTGPHLDEYPPAYPENSMLVRDAKEAEFAVRDFIRDGASAIKVYFRLPLGTIERICEVAHAYQVPVIAHLEITHAKDAIEVGLDGIEHVTSFGTALMHRKDAESYRQLILSDNEARRGGRYTVWNDIKLDDTTYTGPLFRLMRERGTWISPNLAVFERQSDRGDSIQVQGFANMVRFVGQAYQAGVKIVVGSHTFVPYATLGKAYAREMELLVEAGMPPEQVIESATLENARFFKVDERLGSLETGKIADLIVLGENPLTNMAAFREVEKVMLNGHWVK